MATVEDAVGWDGGERVGVDEPGYADVTGGVERDGFSADVKAGNLPCGASRLVPAVVTRRGFWVPSMAAARNSAG